MINPIILTDCDGVLLNWRDAFASWMLRHGKEEKHRNGYSMGQSFEISEDEAELCIEIFNESAAIRYMEPLEESQKYVNLLYHRGYRLRVITSLSGDEIASKARLHNLQDVYGKHAIEGLHCLSCGKSKRETLEKCANEFEGLTTFWIEDHQINAKHGQDLGFETIVKAYNYNESFEGTRLETWKEIYEKILEIENTSKQILEFL